MKILFFRNITLVCSLLVSLSTFAQPEEVTEGKDFWIGLMKALGYSEPPNPLSATYYYLHITSEVATAGVVEVPLQNWDTTFTVVPGVVTRVVIPEPWIDANTGQYTTAKYENQLALPRGIHVTAENNIRVSTLHGGTFALDAQTIKPTQALGTDYTVTMNEGITPSSGPQDIGMTPRMQIVATEDNTEIEINPTFHVKQTGNNPNTLYVPGVIFTIVLNKGETFMINPNNWYDPSVSGYGEIDISGTTVRGVGVNANCKPFAVFVGAPCYFSFNGFFACDPMWEQLIPTEHLGEEYYTAPFAYPSYVVGAKYTYKVVATENNTSVSINNGTPFILNAQEDTTFHDVTTADHILASSPVLTTQSMYSGGYLEPNYAADTPYGDPAMVLVNSENQTTTWATFENIVTEKIDSIWGVNLIVETADVGSVLLDGSPIPAANFTAYASNPNKSYASFNMLTPGSHTLNAPNGFIGYQYGIGIFESYLNSFGYGSTIDSSSSPNTTYCGEGDTLVLWPPKPLTNSEWTISGSATVISTNDTLVIPPPFIEGTYVVTGMSALGCPKEYTFDVLTSPFTVDAGADTTLCATNGFGLNVTTDAVNPIYEWNNSAYLDASTIANPTITADTTLTYLVLVNDGICEVSDSVTISFTPTPLAPIAGTDAEYCSTVTPDDLVATGDGGTLTWYSNTAMTTVLGTGSNFSPTNALGQSTYYVTETVNGCEGPPSQVMITMNLCEVVIPSAFTPDGDGAHDDWEIYNLTEAYPNHVVRIFNRWGNLLYESEEGGYDSDRWDGTYNGENLPASSYYYIIEFNDTEEGSATGTVSIITNK